MDQNTIIPEVYLHALNAFDVGNNPEHINHGLISSTLITQVHDKIDNLADSKEITLSGHALDILDEESPELLAKLNEAVQKETVSLVGAPYYNTSLALLSAEKFQNQCDATQKTFEKYFKRRSTKIALGAQNVPKHLSQALGAMKLSVVGAKSVDGAIGEYSSYYEAMEHNELSQHVSDELKVLEPFLAKDKEFSKTWQLLANTQVLNSFSGENPQYTYDNYYAMMNILNDLAHTVRNVELTKRGEFETTAQIVENPSSRVLEVCNK